MKTVGLALILLTASVLITTLMANPGPGPLPLALIGDLGAQDSADVHVRAVFAGSISVETAFLIADTVSSRPEVLYHEYEAADDGYYGSLTVEEHDTWLDAESKYQDLHEHYLDDLANDLADVPVEDAEWFADYEAAIEAQLMAEGVVVSAMDLIMDRSEMSRLERAPDVDTVIKRATDRGLFRGPKRASAPAQGDG